MSIRHPIAFAVVAGGFGLLGGYSLQVFADGAPTRQPLFYSGSLEQDGQPAEGDYSLTLGLYDASENGHELCTSVREVTVQNGRFRADVSDCADELRGQSDVWVAVSFRSADGVDHAIEGRSKIGAVPYALEADHALNASEAGGALAARLAAIDQQLAAVDERLATIEADSPRASAFQAIKRSAQSTEGSAVVIFDEEKYDHGSEYNPATSTFTPKQAGLYEFSCTVAWAIPDDQNMEGRFEVALRYNDYTRQFNDFASPGPGTSRQIHAVFQLAAFDRVQCAAGSFIAGPQTLNVGNDREYMTFEGRRFMHLEE